MRYTRLFIYIGLICTVYTSLLAEEWTREYSGYSNDEIMELSDGTKISHYKNKGTWKDNLGNFGTQRCIGTVVLDKNNKINDVKVFCQGKDSENDRFTQTASRDDAMEVGVGTNKIIDATGKYKKFIGATCVYAITYVDKAFFSVDKCKN